MTRSIRQRTLSGPFQELRIFRYNYDSHEILLRKMPIVFKNSEFAGATFSGCSEGVRPTKMTQLGKPKLGLCHKSLTKVQHNTASINSKDISIYRHIYYFFIDSNSFNNFSRNERLIDLVWCSRCHMPFSQLIAKFRSYSDHTTTSIPTSHLWTDSEVSTLAYTSLKLSCRCHVSCFNFCQP